MKKKRISYVGRRLKKYQNLNKADEEPIKKKIIKHPEPEGNVEDKNKGSFPFINYNKEQDYE